MDHIKTYTIESERALNLDDKGMCICTICENIFIRPIRCANCDNHFCLKCIEEWLVNNPGNCPLCKNFKIINTSPLLNTLLSNLKIKCLNFFNCNEILGYDFLFKHEENCGGAKMNDENNDEEENKDFVNNGLSNSNYDCNFLIDIFIIFLIF